jgi:hypothetical protein
MRCLGDKSLIHQAARRPPDHDIRCGPTAILRTTPLVGGHSIGFICAYEARVQDNVLFGVRLCQVTKGEDGATTAANATTTIARQINDQISEIAAH